jgi:hypothetical protein
MNRYANAGPSPEQRALDLAAEQAEQAEAPYVYRTPFQRLRAFREGLDALGFDDEGADTNGAAVVDFISQNRAALLDIETEILNQERAPAPRIVVTIDGGNMSGVYASDQRTQVQLIDHDNMEAEGLDSDERDDAESLAIDGLYPVA